MHIKRVLLLALLLVCPKTVFCTPEGPYTLRVALGHNPRSSWVKACWRFEEEVERESQGRMAVEVFHSGQLGSTRQVLELVYLNAIEAAVPGAAQVEAYVKELGVVVLPFLWQNEEDLFAALDGSLGQTLEHHLNQRNFHALTWFANGFRCVTNSRQPIQSVTDMAGLKIRVIPSPVVMEYFEAIDASPVHVDWVELYEALKLGVVDAQENPPFFVYLGRMYEVQRYYSLTEHMNEPGIIVLNKRFYDRLPSDLQSLVDGAALRAAQWQRLEMQKDNAEMLAAIKDSGKTQINTLSEQARAEFRRIAREEVYPRVIEHKLCGPSTEELIDLALSFQEGRP
ncbi:TRAP transporter substrate-binding protein [Planctomycetota bacterium]